MIDVIVIIYLDDILIYSDNISKHKAHVKELLHRLCTNGLFVCAYNASFTSLPAIPWIYVVPQRPHHCPIQSPDHPRLAQPQKVQNVQSFLSFTNFYHASTAVLLITTLNSELHPIAFHSWTFSTLELNYNMHDKEFLMISEAFK